MVKKYVYTGPIKHYCACCGKLLKTEWSGRYESDLDSVMQVDSTVSRSSVTVCAENVSTKKTP